MKHRRHDRPEQKSRIVGRRVGQNILLDDQRSAADRLCPDLVQRRELGGCCGDRVAQPLRCNTPGGEILRVVKGDDLRPPAGEEVVLETCRNIDCRYGIAGADRLRGCRQTIGPLMDTKAWRRGNLLDQAARNCGPVHVDNDDIQPAHHCTAKRPSEYRERDQRNCDDQKPAGPVAVKKPDLPSRDQPEAWRRRGLHCDRPAQSVKTLIPGRNASIFSTG